MLVGTALIRRYTRVRSAMLTRTWRTASPPFSTCSRHMGKTVRSITMPARAKQPRSVPAFVQSVAALLWLASRR